MAQPHIAPKLPKRGRRLRQWLAVFAILLFLGIALLPTMLSTSPARRLLVHAINKQISPGQIELGSWSLSWTSDIHLNDVALLDPHGKSVVTAKSVRTDRGIFGLLASGPDYGTIQVAGATVDAERRADGSIDFLDALGGLMASDGKSQGNPDLALAIVVKGGKVRISSPELSEAISAEIFEAAATIVPGKPLDVLVTIGDASRSLELHVDYDKNAPSGSLVDQTFILTGRDWPIAVHQAGITTKGRFVGTIRADRKQGFWSAKGDVALHGVVADGALLAGDRLAVESITAGCDVTQSKSGWSISKLELKSPVGEFAATGYIPAISGITSQLTGFVDMAALTKLLPLTFRLRDGIVIDRGQVRILADLTREGEADRLHISANVAELAATERGRPLILHHPVSISTQMVRNKAITVIESFAVKAAGLDASATGDLEHGVKLTGSIDLAALQDQARDLIELGALDVAGKGRVAADYRPDGSLYHARFAAEFEGLKVAGLMTEPIVRDHARIEGVVDGPHGRNGLPTNWQLGRVNLHAGETKANFHAKLAGDVTTLVLDGSIPITAPLPALAQGKVSVHRLGQLYDIDELHLSATPSDPKAQSQALSLAAKGRLDLAAGELFLTPLEGQSVSGIGLAAEGLKLAGFGKTNGPISVDASLIGDLAALDRTLAAWTQSPLRGLGGGWSGRMTLARQPGGSFGFNGRIASTNLVVSTPRGPVTLAAKGTYETSTDQLDLASLDLATTFGRLVVGGKVGELTSKRLADISGTLEPQWETLDPIIALAIEPQAQIKATFKPFHLTGSIAGDSISQILKGIKGEVPLDLTAAQAFGLKLGATPITLRLTGGKANFDPILTTLNEGKVKINADLFLDDPEALWLRLGKGSSITDAAINEAVSNDVLSYIAPILSKASHVSGKVSLTVDDAAIPLVGDGALRVDGRLVFDGVTFQPGPFANELYSLTGKTPPQMTIHQPVQLQIAEGRVKQSGLSIPLGGNAKANLEGSVGFDKTLSIRAQLPVTPQMLGNDATVRQIVGDTKITVPIGGTISRPVIDRAGFRLALRDATRSIVKRGVKAEATRMLDQVLPSAGGSKPGGRNRDALKIFEEAGRELNQPRSR